MEAQSRIACLRIPRFQIGAHQKDDATLKGKPLIILAGKGNRANVVMCSLEAEKKQVCAGMKFSEARATAADLVHVEYSETLYQSVQKELCRELIACSPKVTAVEPGLILLDASGLNFLGGETRFCIMVHKTAARFGFPDAHVGLADSAFAAMVASKLRRRRHFIVERGADIEFLSSVSIKHLPVSIEMQESLIELGIRTIGQMASLSLESLSERFGQEGAAAYELARGIDHRRPTLPVATKEFSSFVDIGSAIGLIQEIQFVVKAMTDRLCQALKEQGYWAEELKISFYNDSDLINERPIKLIQPSNNAKFLLEVIRLSLEAHPLDREVTAIKLAASQFVRESYRQIPVSPDKHEATEEPLEQQRPSVALMLQRFMARLGETSVVRAIAQDQHIPELSAVWQPVIGSNRLSVVPASVNYNGAYASAAGLASGLALRTLAAPQPVLVQLKRDKPDAIAFGGRWYWVRDITVPERLSGLWWEQSINHSYYIAFIERKDNAGDTKTHTDSVGPPEVGSVAQALLVLLVHAHQTNSWLITGIYD